MDEKIELVKICIKLMNFINDNGLKLDDETTKYITEFFEECERRLK